MLATEKNQLLPRFNTQPRGGGCDFGYQITTLLQDSFNTQPRGGGC